MIQLDNEENEKKRKVELTNIKNEINSKNIVNDKIKKLKTSNQVKIAEDIKNE
jgi:hypothetical protein